MRHVPKFVALLAVVAVGLPGTASLANAAPTATTPTTTAGGTYEAVAPHRVLDTRIGTGAPKAPVKAGGTVRVKMLGTAGVPTTGVSAVVVNLTVTAATKPSFLTVWPSGTARPNVSSINFVAGTNRANLVTVAVGTIGVDAGKISIWNPAGTVQVIADVLGYYNSDSARTAGSVYQPVEPQRKLNMLTPLAAGKSVSVPVDYRSDFPNSDAHITALAVNISAENPTRPGFLVAWNGVGIAPTTSSVNFAAGTATSNMAIVPVSRCVACGASTGRPSIKVLNGSTGTVRVLVDIVGFYDDGQLVDIDGSPVDGARFKPMTPTRIVDTRKSQGMTPFTGRATKSFQPSAKVVGPDTVSLVTNTTAVLPTLTTYLTVWPDLAVLDFPRPRVSNLNAVKGQTVANATITDLGIDSTFTNPSISVYNNAGAVNVLVDVVGRMDLPLPLGPFAGLAAPAQPQTWARIPTAQKLR